MGIFEWKIRYEENTNWDEVHNEKARDILLKHPEWKITLFHVIGSTRNRICVDVISEDPNFDFQGFDIEGIHVFITQLNKRFVKVLDCFTPLKPEQE